MDWGRIVEQVETSLKRPKEWDAGVANEHVDEEVGNVGSSEQPPVAAEEEVGNGRYHPNRQ